MKDLLVLGGGVIGLSLAWEASRRGFSVTLLEKNRLGGGASQAASGIVPAKGAVATSPWRRFLHESRDLWPKWLQQLEKEGGEIPYWQGGYYAFSCEKEKKDFFQKIERYQIPWEWRDSSFPKRQKVVYLPGEFVVDTEALLSSLVTALQRRGVELREGVEGKAVEVKGGKVTVKDREGRNWCASFCVVAAGVGSGQLLETLGLSLRIIAIKGEAAEVKGEAPKVSWHFDSYHLVPRQKGFLFGATAYRSEEDETSSLQGKKELERAWKHFLDFPFCVKKWRTGLRPRSRDYKPLLGRVRGNLYLATGHYKSGIALAPISAKVLVDALEGKHSPYLQEFSPWRKKGISLRHS